MASHDEAGITPLQRIQSSCTGALLTSLLTTPFDVVRVRLQSQQASLTRACYLMDCRCLDGVTVCYVTPHGRSYSPRYNGTFDVLVKIAELEGISSWWKGLSPTMLMAVPSTVIYYTSYDQLKVYFGFNPEQTNVLAPMLAGSIARTIAVAAVTPLELLRTKIQSRQHYHYSQLWSSLEYTIRRNGILSLWRGLIPTLLRDVPFSIFYWVGYEYLKQNIGQFQSFSDHPRLVALISGGTSGATAALLTNPLDVVKTHMQVGLGEPQPHKLDKSLIKIISRIVSEHGMSGLYTGLVPRIAKISPACAIMISTYESFKIYFTKKNFGDI